MKQIIIIITMMTFVFSVRAQKLIIQKNNGMLESFTFNKSTSKVTFDSNNYKVYIDNELYNYPSSEVNRIYFTKQESSDQESTTGSLNGHEWVDLGLPSGTKWATCNIGASSPNEYGNYYAWGETREKNYYQYDEYDYASTDISSLKIIFKYVGKDISGTDKDVAHVKWGSTWKMPTSAQRDELVNYCQKESSIRNGVKGCLVTGPNGNQIFFPSGGCKRGNSIFEVGEHGYFWTASSTNGYSDKVALFVSSSYIRNWDTTDSYEHWGCYGYMVRPVTR